MSSSLFIFPGQGAQYCGIGSDIHQHFASARAVYDEASSILGFDIAALSFNGPEQELTLTRNTQPVLLTHHIACLRVLAEVASSDIVPNACAGHSLGEYSALVAAGVIDFATALKLVRRRGELMGEFGSGEMLALPLPVGAAQPLAESFYCVVASLNLNDQTVVGGASVDLDQLEQRFREEYPRKRTVRLKTEGAFHTYYMVEAARQFRADLDKVDFTTTDIRVACNYNGLFHTNDPDSIRTKLFLQLFHPVRWLDNLHAALASGIDTIVEFGGGIGKGDTAAEKRPNLEGMIKKAQRGSDQPAQYFAAINCATIAATATALYGT